MSYPELSVNHYLNRLDFCAEPTRLLAQFNKLDVLVIPDVNRIISEQEYMARESFDPIRIQSITGKSAKKEQIDRDFDPIELKSGLENLTPKLFNNPSKSSIDVPCAFVGKFAKSLSSLGFQVRASDILPEWTNRLGSMGLNALLCPAEQLPKLDNNNQKKHATISFEPYPIFENSGSSWIFMLRETSCTEFGPICVESRTGYHQGRFMTLDYIKSNLRLETGSMYSIGDIQQAYLTMSEIYGIPVTMLDTDTLRFTGFTKVSTEIIKKIKLDELLIENFNEINLSNKNEVVKFSISEWSEKLNSQPQELIDSINRLEVSKILFDAKPYQFAYLQPQNYKESAFFRKRKFF